MNFKDMLKARDAAIVHEKKAEAEKAETHTAADSAKQRTTIAHEQAIQATKDSQKAIHDLLETYGERFDVDDVGTVTVYKLSDQEPGYIAVQPIPGTAPVPASEAK